MMRLDPQDYIDLIDLRHVERLPRRPDDEYADLMTLLLENAGGANGAYRRLAETVAHACLGSNHLWQDLGLPDRPLLTRLMADCFAPLAAANTPPMRWKKFFYRELCRREGFHACRAPSCDVCATFAECFAPEDGPPLAQIGKRGVDP